MKVFNAFFSKINGVLGLGKDSLSFMSQLLSEERFSYCLERFPEDGHGEWTVRPERESILVLGEPLMQNKKQTRIIMDQGHYFVSISEIWIGDKKLDAPFLEIHRFIRTPAGGAMIDTGSSVNMLTSLWLR